MKNILLILLLANILYFVWGRSVEEVSQPGVDLVTESDLGPALVVTTVRDSNAFASVGAVLGSGEPSALNAVVGRSCVSIGPFETTGLNKRSPEAELASLEYIDEGMKATLRSTLGEVFSGHWVQIRNVADDVEADDFLRQLEAAGLDTAYAISTDEEGMKISIGLFADIERAERVELQALSLGIPAEISRKTREEDVIFVDIGLPPGRGAGTIVEKYGQDRVLLRGEATCPQ
jgi:hypothetical protein